LTVCRQWEGKSAGENPKDRESFGLIIAIIIIIIIIIVVVVVIITYTFSVAHGALFVAKSILRVYYDHERH
jgi:flagellar basal body-associated protein FliL